MMFFVPYTPLGDEAEFSWCELRSRLARIGLPTTRRRIAALRLTGDGKQFLLHVGMACPHDGEDVMMIMEAADRALFYICTSSHGVDEGAPFVLGGVGVFDFDERVAAQA